MLTLFPPCQPIPLGDPKSCQDISPAPCSHGSPWERGCRTISSHSLLSCTSILRPHLSRSFCYPPRLFSPIPETAHQTPHMCHSAHSVERMLGNTKHLTGIPSCPKPPVVPTAKGKPSVLLEDLLIWTFSSVSGTQDYTHISGTLSLLPVLHCILLQFPVAAVTNHYQLCNLRQHKFFFLQL